MSVNTMDEEDRYLLPDSVQSDFSPTPKTQCSRLCECLNSYHDTIVVFIGCISATSMGFILGYSSPVLIDEEFLDILGHDDTKTSWFSSIVAISAIIGGLLASLCVEKFGRKTTILISNIPLAVGWLMIMLTTNVAVIISGRALTGIAMGMASLSAPLYIGEVSSKQHRGMLGACFQLCVTIGILAVYALGMVLSWKWLAAAGIALAAASTLLLPGVPESPRWLIAKGKNGEANQAFRWLATSTNESEVNAEYSEMEANVLRQSYETFSIRDLIRPGVYKPLSISLALMLIQQFSGINAVIFYSAKIFESAGFKSNPLVPAIVVATILVLFTVASCLLMDRAGRRLLLMISGLFLTLSAAALGTYYLLSIKHGMSLNWLSLSSVCVFVAAFSLGWGPIPWLAMSELLPSRARGVGSGISTSFNWLFAFIVTKEFLPVVTAITQYGTFYAFSAVNLAGIVFIFFILPETKGRSLEEIENMFVA